MKRWRRTTGLVLAGLILIALAVQAVSFRHDLPRDGISPDSGFAYTVAVNPPWLIVPEGDSGESPAASPLRLFEDGKELGPGHMLHAEIRSSGEGRFSHWNQSLWFSASDNSDPRTNGRIYTLVRTLALPAALGWGIAGVLVAAALACVTTRGRRADASGQPVTRKSVLSFCLVFLATWGAAMMFYGQWWDGHKPRLQAYELLPRIETYLKDPGRFNLLFMGDSKSYCNIHPDLIDPLVGTRSVNLSHYTHWFPSQYAMVRDTVAAIPKNSVVVWSFSHVNVLPGVLLGEVYPVGWSNIPRFLAWNVPLTGISANLLQHTPVLSLIDRRQEIRKLLLQAADVPMPNIRKFIISQAHAGWPPEPRLTTETPNANWHHVLQEQYGNDQRVVSFGANSHDGKLTSITLLLRGGSHYRIEIDPAFFRARQAEGAEKPISEANAASYPVALNEGYLRLLDETLELYRQAGLRVIVNEQDEAPHRYAHPLVREKWRKLMRDVVKPMVEAKGFAYVWTDLDQLTDSDYFDYNHMNSRGIAKYTPMLAAKLQEAMRAKGWELR